MKQRILIYDLDGVCIDSSIRAAKHINVDAYKDGDYNTWLNSLHTYSKTIEGDTIILEGVKLVQDLINEHKPDKTYALTARGSQGKELTYNFIKTNLPWDVSPSDLIMNFGEQPNENGDFSHYTLEEINKRSPVEFKRYWIKKLKKEYDIVCAIDDHPHIIKMYIEENINAVLAKFEGIDCLSPAGDQIRK